MYLYISKIQVHIRKKEVKKCQFSQSSHVQLEDRLIDFTSEIILRNLEEEQLAVEIYFNQIAR